MSSDTDITPPTNRKIKVTTKNKVWSRRSGALLKKPALLVWDQFRAHLTEFGVLCCLTTPGLRKDIRRQIRQLYSHKVTYYVHYNYILSSHLLSHSHFYFNY